MRFLFDQNLSYKLCRILVDLFPESEHVRKAGLEQASDLVIWRYASERNLIVVTFDADFADMAVLYGPPPKVIWLRCGNQGTLAISARLSANHEAITHFAAGDLPVLEIY